ncbi:M14 family metallopeptidase [Brevibacillus porteri]|uniref:M14 family metallopeptidase n=1 Tax=Brevibacillus porteri TaxID=2126350 RepID=UPI003D2446A0
MRGLGDIFTTKGLVADRNNDGVADSLSVSFCFQTGIVVEGFIDFCARLGLETSELDLPSIRMKDSPMDASSTNSGEWLCTVWIEPACDVDDASCTLDRGNNRIAFVGGSEESLSRLLRWMAAYWTDAAPATTSLGDIERIRCSLHEVHLYVCADASPVCQIAIPQYALMSSHEESPIVERPTPLDSLTELWTTAGFYQAGRTDLTSRTDVFFTGIQTAEAVMSAARFAARIGLASTGIHFPLTGEANRIAELTFSLHMDGEAPLASGVVEVIPDPREKTTRVIQLSGGGQAIVAALDYFGTATSHRLGGTFGAWEEADEPKEQEFPLFIEKTWKDQGERNEIEQLFHEQLIAIASRMETDGCSYSPLAVTAFLSEPKEIRRALELCWRNAIMELLPENDSTVQIHSAFKPGLCWIKETILPSLVRTGERVERISISFQREDREGGMELSHRWLQELYPVDQLLEKELGLSLSQVSFVMDENLPTTYQVEAWGVGLEHVGIWNLDVPVSTVPYADEQSRAYPTTSGLFFSYGTTKEQFLVPTDRERFWQFYTQQFLTELTEELLCKQNEPYQGNIPLFHSIEVTVTMSEQEERLDIDEETLSSLEALHEDIYFYTLDYYAYLGERKTGVAWNSPGAVRPFVKVKPASSPVATIRVKEYKEEQAFSIKTTHLYFEAEQSAPVKARILRTNEKTTSIEERKLPYLHRNHHPDLGEWAELATHPSVHMWEVEKSFEGRPIFAVEVTAPQISKYVSTHKLSLYKPTILLETGHHPNEVSSMPAARELVAELITEKMDWLTRFNLVVIPFANPDGVALHQELVKDNPFWKHHAARYNAVGLEYTNHRFQPSVFGESRVVPQLFYRWLPDVIIDDHGIPSHEWTQPFAGYNSPPRFPVSYWIPISLFYGIGREMERSDYPHHAVALDTIQKAAEDGLRHHPRLWNKNKHFIERYIRYGHNWEPAIFPVPTDQDFLFYRWPTKPNRTSPSLLSRFPEWVTLDLITEAADETVAGGALRDCIETHKVFNRAVMECVASSPRLVSRQYGKDRIRLSRMRPMRIGGDNHEDHFSNRV